MELMMIDPADSTALSISWFDFVLCLLVPAVSFGAAYRWRSGWGGRISEVRQGGVWEICLVHAGFGTVPFGLGMLSAVLGLAAVFIGSKFEYGWLAVVALVFFSLAFVTVAWGFKEMWRPSRWRYRPEWVKEFESRRAATNR